MKVELTINGKKVPMNKFVQKIVGSTVKGMVDTLDDIDQSWKTLELKLERD